MYMNIKNFVYLTINRISAPGASDSTTTAILSRQSYAAGVGVCIPGDGLIGCREAHVFGALVDGQTATF